MAINFPTSLDSAIVLLSSTYQDDGSSLDALTVVNNMSAEIIALETKVGINNSADNTSFDYKLSGIATGDKAVSKTGTETLTNKTLTSPTINSATINSSSFNSLTTSTIINTGTLTLPTVTDTLVARTTTDTLTNKTLNSNTNIISFFGREGYLINGKLKVVVSGNNITVSIVDNGGNNPTASSPVFVTINGTLRTISSTLSVTLNGGTNYFNASGNELNNTEIDYFVYLAWVSGSSAVAIGFARIPNATTFVNFSASATAEKYGAFSTTPANSDAVVLIDRFNATLNTNNWSSGGTIIEGRPIFETRELNFSPQYSASGSMTYTSVSTFYAQYKINKNGLIEGVGVSGVGTTGGTASDTCICTVPFTINTSAGGLNIRGGAAVEDAGTIGGFFYTFSTTQLGFRRYDGANWGLGTSRKVFAYNIAYPY